MILDPDRPATRVLRIPEIDRQRMLRMVAEGVTLSRAVEACGFSTRTVHDWVRNDPAFAEQYRRARQLQADAFVDAMIDIAQRPASDMAAVQRNKLEIETYKWYSARVAPRRWGEKILADHTHTVGVVLLPALDVAQKAIATQPPPLKQIAESSD